MQNIPANCSGYIIRLSIKKYSLYMNNPAKINSEIVNKLLLENNLSCNLYLFINAAIKKNGQ